MFDTRDDDDVILNDRQNEVIVIPSNRMNAIQYLYTLGMAPCIGLVLWCPDMCAMAHFHDHENLGQVAPVLERFAWVVKNHGHKANYKVMIVRAYGQRTGNAWHSQAMVDDLRKAVSAAHLSYDEVFPKKNAPPDEDTSVNVCIGVETGTLEYAFTPVGRDSGFIRVAPNDEEAPAALPLWIRIADRSAALVIGKYIGSKKIKYEEGTNADAVRALLA